MVSGVLIHVVSILSVMLSEAKYLFISLDFWRREVLRFVQDDRKGALCLAFRSRTNCESMQWSQIKRSIPLPSHRGVWASAQLDYNKDFIKACASWKPGFWSIFTTVGGIAYNLDYFTTNLQSILVRKAFGKRNLADILKRGGVNHIEIDILTYRRNSPCLPNGKRSQVNRKS